MSDKRQSIKLLILDVDGVLTTGLIYFGDPDIKMRAFHILDGLGIQMLQKSGIKVAVISGKKSEAVATRLRELAIDHVYLGQDNKLPAYEELKLTLQLNDSEIAYMGDDLPDLPLLRRAGLAMTVPHAPAILKQHADYISKNKGGQGAVREVCEWIMQGQGTLQSVIEFLFLR